MANTIITPLHIAKEQLFQLKNNAVMHNLVHRDYKKEFVKVGGTVQLRKPVKLVSVSGAAMTPQDVDEGTIDFVIQNRKHVGWGFNTQDLTLTIEQYAERYLEPAGITLNNDLDLSITALYSDLWTSGGTPGVTPSAFADLGTFASFLDDAAVPDDMKRRLVLNPAARWSLADALKGVYDNSMPKDFIRKGLLGQLANFQIYGDQNIQQHTTGSQVDDPILVDGGTLNSNATPQANTMTMHFDAFSANVAGALKAGDVFTLALVYAVNPINKQTTGRLMQFTVVSDVTSAAGESDVVISPSIRSTGAYQNVTVAPIDNAAVTFLGANSTSYAQNMGFHKNALGVVMCPLALPDGVPFKSRITHDGISLRVLKSYSILDDEDIIRIDLLWGSKAIYPDLGGRLWGA